MPPAMARARARKTAIPLVRALLGCILGALLAGCAAAPPGPPSGAPPSIDLRLRPHQVKDGWVFSCRAPSGAKSVHLAGEFNGWSTSAWPMSDADGDGIWTITVPLEANQTYQYKFVVNGTEWVTDPNAEAVDAQNFNNSILHTRGAGEPYLADIQPADGAVMTDASGCSATVHLEGLKAGTPSVVLSDFMGRRSFPLSVRFDPASGRLAADFPAGIVDDDYRLRFAIPLSGRAALERTTSFSLDRWAGRVDSPAFHDSAVVYEIFVRAFKDGRGQDGIGDLEGLIASLDYLNDGNPETRDDLGVDAIWMMPIHPSPSPHGYDITDYEDINRDYGTLEDFRRLVAEAHRRGMRVILDYVVNHSSDKHPFFQSSFRDPSSPYSSWYQFNDPRNHTYGSFAGYGGMPQFNFQSPQMRAYLLKVARFWIDLDGDGDYSDGVDGFRCDVAKGPPHNFWKELRRETRGLRGDFMLLAEVWDNARTIAPYFHNEFDMNFDYPLYYATLDLLGGRRDPAGFFREYEAGRNLYPAGAQLCRFLDNHDNNRIASVLGQDERRIRLATGLLFSLPGTPLLYYGTEIGTPGVKPDPDLRKPMRWDFVASQTGDPASLLSWHRNLIRLRREIPALWARDDVETRSLFPGQANDPDVMVYERCRSRREPAALVVANLDGQAREARVTLAGSDAVTRGRLRLMLSSGGAGGAPPEVQDLSRGLDVELAPYEVRIYRLDP